MKEKKSAKANLESKRGLFIEIGLIIVLVLVYMAFEMKSNDANITDIPVRSGVFVDDDWTPIPQPEKIELPPPPPQQPILLAAVDNDIDTKKDIIVDAGADESTPIETPLKKPDIFLC